MPDAYFSQFYCRRYFRLGAQAQTAVCRYAYADFNFRVFNAVNASFGIYGALVRKPRPRRPRAYCRSGCIRYRFLGAGTILRQGLNIKGLTSSAIIWSAAALGLAIGAGFVIPAYTALFLYVFALIFLEKVEEKYFPAERAKHLNLVFENKRVDLDALSKLIHANGLIIMTTDVTRILGQKHLSISFSVRVPPSLDIFRSPIR